MGTESGRPPTTLTKTLAEELFDEAFRFEFFQAVRLLERIAPRRTPVGRAGDQGAAERSTGTDRKGDASRRAAGLPAREVVRFRTRSSLEFPASQIYEVKDAADTEQPPEMTVAFFGLTGTSGVLPAHYTELAAERTRYKDSALADFLDLFNHRLLSLFHRAWEKYRFHIAYERGGDPVTEHLYDLIGMGTEGLRGQAGVPDEALLFYSGHLASRPRSAAHINQILGDYFGVRVRVEQFAGQWLALDDEAITRLGQVNSELGRTTVIGSRVWDAQSKFRLRFGPLTLQEFTQFLPTSTAFAPVADMTRLLVGLEFDFDLELILRREEVPESRLSSDPDAPAQGARLGWTSWLKTTEFAGDDPAVVFAVKE